jgi:hypothetical protein
MSYGTQWIKFGRDGYGIPYLSRVTGVLTEEDWETLQTNGFINLGPILTIYKDEETRRNVEDKQEGWIKS